MMSSAILISMSLLSTVMFSKKVMIYSLTGVSSSKLRFCMNSSFSGLILIYPTTKVKKRSKRRRKMSSVIIFTSNFYISIFTPSFWKRMRVSILDYSMSLCTL